MLPVYPEEGGVWQVRGAGKGESDGGNGGADLSENASDFINIPHLEISGKQGKSDDLEKKAHLIND